MDCSPPASSVHGSLQARPLDWVAMPSSRGSSQGIKPRSPAFQADSLPSETPGTPKSTGVGSLSLLQEIFPAQESNWGLVHYRGILYQLSHQGSLLILLGSHKTRVGSQTLFSCCSCSIKTHHASVLRLCEQASCPKPVALRPLNCEFLDKWINSLRLSCLILKY